MASREAIGDIIFVGDGPEVLGLFDRLKHPERVLGYFCDADVKENMGIVFLGRVSDAAKYIDSNPGVFRVYCGMSCIGVDVVRCIQDACKVRAVKFCAVLPVINELEGNFVPMHVGKSLLLTPHSEPLSRFFNAALKRGLDFLLSLVMLLTLFPVVYLCKYIIAKKLHLGTAIRTQWCSGPNGKQFRRFSFRVPEGKVPSGWDYLPELMNVFVGQMSLVGPPPVPETSDGDASMSDSRFHRSYVKSGMAGWRRIEDGDGCKNQITRDIWYTENWSIWQDASILFRSILGS